MGTAIVKLRRLKEMDVDAPDRPLTLPSDKIDTMENVFQARDAGLNEQHLGELETAIRDHGVLEPLILWRCGVYAIVLEGHHRLEAYRRVEAARGRPIQIPVVWFEGSVEEAVIKAASSNSRPKLPMSKAERSEHAWRLVVTRAFKVSEVMTAASVSKRLVINQRSVLNTLGDEAAAKAKSWRAALAAAKGLKGEDQNWSEAEVEAQAQEWADRLAKEFSTKLAHQPDITAKALNIYFNRKSEEIIRAWLNERGLALEDFLDEDEEHEPPESGALLT
jgi:hypothetical protein